MPDLDAQIRQRLEWSEGLSELGEGGMANAIRAVLDLHKPCRGQGYDEVRQRLVPIWACSACGTAGEYAVPDPCPTKVGIANALGIEAAGA